MERFWKFQQEGSALALALIVCVALFLVWSYSYPPSVRLVPVLIGWGTLAFAVADFLVRFRGRPPEPKTAGGGATGEPGQERKTPPSRRVEIIAVAWIGGLAAGIYLFGFLLTSPLYVALSLRLRGKKSWRYAAIATVAVTFGIWLVFSKLMRYELYRGILFEGFY